MFDAGGRIFLKEQYADSFNQALINHRSDFIIIRNKNIIWLKANWIKLIMWLKISNTRKISTNVANVRRVYFHIEIFFYGY